MTTNIEKKVMASVGLIYMARKITSPFALQCYALVASVGAISLFVSVPNVVQNFQAVASGGLASIAMFVFSAIVSTTLAVQASLLLGSAAFVSLLVRAARSLSTSRVVAA